VVGGDNFDIRIRLYLSSGLTFDLSLEEHFAGDDQCLRPRSRRHEATFSQHCVEPFLFRHG
jgi:hypothetical protein